MRQKRKAISPIIATLILIVITVVAGIALYGFVSGFMGSLSSTTSSTPPNVQITAVGSSSYTTAKGQSNYTILNYSVTNAGTFSVTFTSAPVYNATSNTGIGAGTFIKLSTTSTLKSVTIKPGSTEMINISVSYNNKPLPAGNYYVKLTTSTGYTEEAPTIYVS